MSIIVYYINENLPAADYFESAELGLALSRCEQLRRAGHRHVSISSENDESVGQPGVDTVVNGKTPDGVAYDWKKRRP